MLCISSLLAKLVSGTFLILQLLYSRANWGYTFQIGSLKVQSLRSTYSSYSVYSEISSPTCEVHMLMPRSYKGQRLHLCSQLFNTENTWKKRV